jgi:replicative DNA helicase
MCVLAAEEVKEYIASREEWQEELAFGKMFGVLIVQKENKQETAKKEAVNEIGYLAAFSGNLAGKNLHPYFVPPVYDLLQPEGFFKIEEEQISSINIRIRELENNRSYLDLKEKWKTETEQAKAILNQALNSALDKIEEAQARGGSITGLSTGFADLDKLTSGLQPADMIVIAGRPSCGKTTIGMNIADHVAQTSGKHVMVFSLEMPEDQLTRRLLASNGMVNMTKINNADLDDDDWGRLSMATSKLMESKMLIDDAGGLTPSELRARAKRAHKENELGLILIDYLGLMRVPQLAGNRNAEISEISQSVKELAKELNVPVIVLSQLNRSLEQRADKRPINSDLRDSGAIEQDADLILFVYRDEVYNDNSPDRGTAELIIGKQRNGPLGKVRLTFQGEYSRFCNFAGPRFNDEY